MHRFVERNILVVAGTLFAAVALILLITSSATLVQSAGIVFFLGLGSIHFFFFSRLSAKRTAPASASASTSQSPSGSPGDGSKSPTGAIQLQQIQANRLASLGIMAGGIAHEINNPLSIVSGLLYIITKRYLPNPTPDLEKTLQKMRDAIDRIAGIISNMLIYAKEEENNVFNVDIHEVTRDTVAVMGHLLTTAEVKVDMRLTNEDICVRGNYSKIQQVLINMIKNSVDALKTRAEDRRLVIETCKYGEELALSITDNGCGIKKEHKDKIFTPFFTTKTVGEGTGLGLAISRSIMKTFDGSFEFSSTENKGSTFVLSMKIAHGQADVMRPAWDSFRTSGDALVIDSESDLRGIHRIYLEDIGLRVFEAATADEAMRMMGERLFRLVLVSLDMPEKNGIAIVREARTSTTAAAAKFIIITEENLPSYEQNTQDFINDQVDANLQKPIDDRELQILVHNVLKE